MNAWYRHKTNFKKWIKQTIKDKISNFYFLMSAHILQWMLTVYKYCSLDLQINLDYKNGCAKCMCISGVSETSYN